MIWLIICLCRGNTPPSAARIFPGIGLKMCKPLYFEDIEHKVGTGSQSKQNKWFREHCVFLKSLTLQNELAKQRPTRPLVEFTWDEALFLVCVTGGHSSRQSLRPSSIWTNSSRAAVGETNLDILRTMVIHKCGEAEAYLKFYLKFIFIFRFILNGFHVSV